jgi:GNAT superfamily N-acetyltransferase
VYGANCSVFRGEGDNEVMRDEVEVMTLNVGDKFVVCPDIIEWAEKWEWGVGEIVAKRLRDKKFTDWEAIAVLRVRSQYAGLCILEKRDEWGTDIDDSLTPFITAFYIDPAFRGQGLSGKLIDAACVYAGSIRFENVYLISGEQGFYEKFGFEAFTQTITRSGKAEPVYRKKIRGG